MLYDGLKYLRYNYISLGNSSPSFFSVVKGLEISDNLNFGQPLFFPGFSMYISRCFCLKFFFCPIFIVRNISVRRFRLMSSAMAQLIAFLST